MDFRHLGFKEPGSQPVAKELLEPVHGVLGKAAAMVARVLVSFFHAALGNVLQCLAARMPLCPRHRACHWRRATSVRAETPPRTSSNQTLMFPRLTSELSYSGQFFTRYFALPTAAVGGTLLDWVDMVVFRLLRRLALLRQP